MHTHDFAPTNDECATCPECGEGHSTLLKNVETELDRHCNGCLVDALVDRVGDADRAVTYMARRAAQEGEN